MTDPASVTQRFPLTPAQFEHLAREYVAACDRSLDHISPDDASTAAALKSVLEMHGDPATSVTLGDVLSDFYTTAPTPAVAILTRVISLHIPNDPLT